MRTKTILACGILSALIIVPAGFVLAESSVDATTGTTTTRHVFGSPDCGDANMDGVISSSDALATLLTAVGLADCSRCECDVNASGTVTATDSSLDLQSAVGLPITLVCDTCRTGTCGDGIIEGTEQCDGANDAACPGLCRSDCACAVYRDDFDRQDSDDLDNGWISPAGRPSDFWTLDGGQAVMHLDNSWTLARHNGRLRPLTEGATNAEATVDFMTTNPANFPQIWLRFREITTNALEGYWFYVSDTSEGVGVVRWGGNRWAWSQQDTSWQPLPNVRYKMIARAVDGDAKAVVLTMRILDLDAGGTEVYANTWVDDGTLCLIGTRPCTVQGPGRSGLGGFPGCPGGCTIEYDNFTVTDLDYVP